ncbi:zinc finger MYM-type protein 1-like [Aphis craccivora]|uniref:Zinc finger MYM-type protein 1-like n=1 Tax=Aphis craccivora TaxID=307492 RepID=A0A6G0VZR1_APHCR|nr:zinc finger MYM-type protein 1-like [Aphis craccivora]
MEVLPGDTYRVAEVASDGREVYATTAHVTQLKSWKVAWEDDDDERQPETESEDDGVQQEEIRVDRFVTEEEDRDSTVRPKRTRRLPAHLSGYQLN